MKITKEEQERRARLDANLSEILQRRIREASDKIHKETITKPEWILIDGVFTKLPK